MQTVASSTVMPQFETEDTGGGVQRLILNDNERTRQIDAGHTDTTRTEYLYDRYTASCACDTTAERMATTSDAWAQYIKSADRASAAMAARAERDRRLAECDWTMTADAKTVKSDWKTYRQALRDIPEQEGFPYAISWPNAPEKN